VKKIIPSRKTADERHSPSAVCLLNHIFDIRLYTSFADLVCPRN